MSRSATEETIEGTESLVKEYLQRNDNGRGEVFFKASHIAEKSEGMNARQAGRGLAEIENEDIGGISVERWGMQRSTRWRAFYTD